MRSSGNPGGAGHQWVKDYFIDRAPLGGVPYLDPATGMTRMFIRSRVQDNRILLMRDPGYVARLKGVGSAELVRAWLEGDWSAVTGAYFTEFSLPHHIKAPHKIPDHWVRFRAFDWGYAAPFCCLWICVSDGSDTRYPRGALIVYREYYGATAPNKGVRLDIQGIARGILERESKDEDIAYSVADPSIFSPDSKVLRGPSMAEIFGRNGVNFRRGDNDRLNGSNQIRGRLVGDEDRPMIYFFSTCTNLIRTLPTLQHDDAKPELYDTEGEDHAVDSLRYGCQSRPFVRGLLPVEPMRGANEMTLDELWEKDKEYRTRVRR